MLFHLINIETYTKLTAGDLKMSGLFSSAITAKPEVETLSTEVIPRAIMYFGSKALGG